jgi:uncharacterized protein YbjQ (UPF0145 family)
VSFGVKATKLHHEGHEGNTKELVRTELRFPPLYCAGKEGLTMPVPHNMTTTTFELDNYRVVRNLGLVRGIIVRSRSIIGTIGAGLQTLIGGNISLFTELCEKTRGDAYELMLQHAAQLGANAVIGVRYDATEIAGGVTEVLCYGTAVMVEAVR